MPIQTFAEMTMSPAVTIGSICEDFTRRASHYICTMYCAISGNSIAIATIVAVVILSFLLPEISQKLHASQELKSMKKVFDEVSNDVKSAEVACLTVADEICYLHCNMHDDTTETSKQKMEDLSVCTSHCMRTTQSEPVQVEKKNGFFRRLFYPNRNTSHKEITIMSYVYTNSFDAKNKSEQQQQQSQLL